MPQALWESEEENGEQMIEKLIRALRMDFHETDIYTILGESSSLERTINRA